jgi:hypothetical protein
VAAYHSWYQQQRDFVMSAIEGVIKTLRQADPVEVEYREKFAATFAEQEEIVFQLGQTIEKMAAYITELLKRLDGEDDSNDY